MPNTTTTILKSCSLFRGFSETGIIVMDKIARERSIPVNTPIFVENMVAESMFVIKAGTVNLSLKNSQGKEVVMDTISPGESFGELSLLFGGHRLVTATAATDCELIEINRRDFASIQKQKPKTCLKVMIAIVRQFGHRLVASRDDLKPLLLSQVGD